MMSLTNYLSQTIFIAYFLWLWRRHVEQAAHAMGTANSNRSLFNPNIYQHFLDKIFSVWPGRRDMAYAQLYKIHPHKKIGFYFFFHTFISAKRFAKDYVLKALLLR